ncbi:hypothetical protein UA08_02901 [Talaromyces atroroseus]|uniref:Uncharacterized protein n=1 Tax=Talaromyces atroroseus TaxID=1441469 RepID=A0A225ASH7_TALAT|nr:hypothetical protein UA08_02901 [Talaromyces atroroseus]OKL62453.1 hypothetical protein UA08_02901 [Talaromyces atroroseus]
MATEVDAFVDDPRFNQNFELLSSLGSTIKVTYADYGYRNEAHPEEETVLLWFGPMMASRLIGILRDKAARQDKIRIIAIDRPGMGGTDAVPGESRIRICREVVIALLDKLSIQHVCLAAHSGGTVYALDTLLHHPGILSPSRPYLALGAPWLLPKHTSSTAMAMIQRLPTSVVGNTHQLMKVMRQLGGSSIASSLASSTPSRTAETGDELQIIQKMWPSIVNRMHSENTEGVSAEALLLLQKVGNGSGWDDWGDYDLLIPRLVQSLRAANRGLRLEIFYAEKDWMIGDAGSRGPAWFDGCWTTQAAEVVDHHSRVVAGADHDTVWDLQWDATRTLFESIRAVR